MLTLAAGFSSLGIPFLVGGAVALVVGPRERWPSRAFLVVVPAVLFSAWYFAWGNQAESHVSLANALDAPRYVAEALVANLGSAVGLNPDPTTGALGRGPNPEPGLNPVWNWIIVGAIVGAIVLRQLRGARLSPLFWPAAAIALTNWVLTALNYFPGREPTNSRYQYAGGVFVLMLVASLFDGIRPSRRIVAAAGAGAALAVVPHVIVLEKGADFLDEQSVLTRADTAAIEIARNTVDPAFQLTSEVAGTSTLPNIYAGEYLKATGEYGSPAYTPAELEAAPQPGRYQADIVLIHALPVALSTELGGFVARSSRSSCPALPLGEKPEIELRPGTTARIEVAPGPDARFRLRRFSRGKYPITTEGKPGGSVSELSVPADAASLPWRLLVEAEQAVHVCR